MLEKRKRNVLLTKPEIQTKRKIYPCVWSPKCHYRDRPNIHTHPLIVHTHTEQSAMCCIINLSVAESSETIRPTCMQVRNNAHRCPVPTTPCTSTRGLRVMLALIGTEHSTIALIDYSLTGLKECSAAWNANVILLKTLTNPICISIVTPSQQIHICF